MKKSFKQKLIDLGLSYKKEMAIIVLINLFCVIASGILFVFLNSPIALAGGGMTILLANFLLFSRYGTLQRSREKEHLDELISLLSYFEIFITNKNNVYMSFRLLLPYCSGFMDEVINSLLNQIDMDKSVGPFITFAQKFNSHLVESLMLSIYQMVDNGENSGQFMEFEIFFAGIGKDHQIALIEDKKKSLDSLNHWPLFGAGAITIVIAFSITTIIGAYIDVL